SVDERRKFKRIFFSMKNGPLAVLSGGIFPESKLETTVMDLSSGGMGLICKKDDMMNFKAGDDFIIDAVSGIDGLESFEKISAKIIWIQDYRDFQHILFGCEYNDISPTQSDIIQGLIDVWAS
ncbi:PilZ domain-containing protein, partial [Desulfobacterales bacterium HSG16]|nr:PilZ domain-containing protein [Desulfobacterales bacterium HSG16]